MAEKNPYYQTPTEESTPTQNPYINQIAPQVSPLNINTADFIKGALIGAAATYLLTNEKAQKTIFKTLAKGTQMFQAGIEEMKERMEDAQAEMEAEKV